MLRELQPTDNFDGQKRRVELKVVFEASIRQESAGLDHVDDLQEIGVGIAVVGLRQVEVMEMGEAEEAGGGD